MRSGEQLALSPGLHSWAGAGTTCKDRNTLLPPVAEKHAVVNNPAVILVWLEDSYIRNLKRNLNLIQTSVAVSFQSASALPIQSILGEGLCAVWPNPSRPLLIFH